MAHSNQLSERSNPKLVFLDESGNEVDYVPPRNKKELKQWAQLFLGLTIPEHKVCRKHQAPLDAFAAAYFAEAPVVVWRAARGLGGKSSLLGALGIFELLIGADVVVLGGSARQSQRVHELEMDAWNHEVQLGDQIVHGPFRSLLASEPTGWQTRTKRGNSLIAITASTKSARGPHPVRLRLDEVDEMDRQVFESALGQPMDKNGIRNQTVISSTLQYTDGTMQYALELAKQKRWPIFNWCWKESHANNGGWLTNQMLIDAKTRIPENMWKIEVELGEAAIEGRVLSEAALAKLFSSKTRGLKDKYGKLYEFEAPSPFARYATGCDWGRRRDYTCIVTLRIDCIPFRLVAFEKAKDEDWPLLAARFERRVRRYPGVAVHDAWGVGDVVQSYLHVDAIPFTGQQGIARRSLYADYLLGIENGLLQAPSIESVVTDHKYLTDDQLYGDAHTPDAICAGALAYAAATGRAERAQKDRPKQGTAIVHKPIVFRTRRRR